MQIARRLFEVLIRHMCSGSANLQDLCFNKKLFESMECSFHRVQCTFVVVVVTVMIIVDG